MRIVRLRDDETNGRKRGVGLRKFLRDKHWKENGGRVEEDFEIKKNEHQEENGSRTEEVFRRW